MEGTANNPFGIKAKKRMKAANSGSTIVVPALTKQQFEVRSRDIFDRSASDRAQTTYNYKFEGSTMGWIQQSKSIESERERKRMKT